MSEPDTPKRVAQTLLGAASIDQCHLILCAPTNKSEFQSSPENWRRRYRRWSDLDREYRRAGLDMKRQARLLDLLERRGLNIARAAQASDFSRSVNLNPRLVFLLAHCEGGSEIQFWDRSLFIHELAECIPSNGRFLLYGSVCSAVGFRDTLKTRAPNAVISSPGDNTQVGVAGALVVATLVLTAVLNGESLYSAFTKANLVISI